MSDSWSAVQSKKKPQNKKIKDRLVPAPKEAEIQEFLETLKTRPCTNTEHHDPFQCPHYHNEKDRRRNPFAVYVDPLDKTLNRWEKMYHPVNYRTALCRDWQRCPRGEMCAFAHRGCEVRSGQEYNAAAEVPRGQVLGDSITTTVRSDDGIQSGGLTSTFGWGVTTPRGHESVFVPFDVTHAFGVELSGGGFLRILKDMAMKQLCSVTPHRETRDGPEGVLLIGTNANDAAREIKAELNVALERACSVQWRRYPPRVLEMIEEQIRSKGPAGLGAPGTQTRASVDRRANELIVCAPMNSRSVACNVFSGLDVLVDGHKYNQYVQCGCCLEDKNEDEGIACANRETPHFFCAECFDELLKSQLPQIKSQGLSVLCPNCNCAFDERNIARNASKQAYAKLQDAIVDAKVADATSKLQTEFDERLEAKVQEILQSYGSAGDMDKFQARTFAAKARNEALNLKCPGCATVYFDFDGCMALTCGSCKQHFCGWCHKGPFVTGRGAHEHVRECDMNLTANGSYYASPDEIRRGQQRYRTKALKKYLREGYSKDMRNMIVIELGTDLDDLGINPQALYEVTGVLPAGVN